MTDFQIHPLQDGFEYPVSPEQIQELISSTPAVIRLVLFSGLPEPFSPGLVNTGPVLCMVEALCSDSGYLFDIEVNGVRSDRTYERNVELSHELLSQVKGWIKYKSQQIPPKHYETSAKLRLVLEVKNMKLLIRSIVNN